jgi:outer membrane protein OmpA-like peptidoglycan-associated protein
MTALLAALVALTPVVASAVKIPLVKDLKITGAASERQGDYESQIVVESIDPDGTLHLSTSADLPDADGGPPHTIQVTRIVHAEDLSTGREYRYIFSTAGQEDFPGSTSLGTSAAVLSDLASKGEASVKLDGEVGGLAGLMGGMLGALQGSGAAKDGYLTGTGVLKLADPKPVPFTVIVNNAVAALPAWHVKGRFGEADQAVDVEWYILDDAKNPLTLRLAFGKEKLEIVRIEFPVEDEAQAIETALAKKKRSVLYGIYFDFNSSTIKPQSDPVLRTIAGVMKKNPDWTLVIEGHTDNIGGDARNRELSAHRASAVKAALVERGVAAARLDTAGYGRSVPKETNATLAGRARNRRVELSRP